MKVPASVAPRTDDLNLKSHVDTHPKAPLPPTTATSSSTQERQAWMLEPTTEATPTVSTFFTDRNLPKSAGIATRKPMASSAGDGMSEAELLNRNVEGEMDLFSSLGTEHKRKDPEADKPDPSKPQVYRNELNQQLVQGKSLDEYETKGKALSGLCHGGYMLIVRGERGDCWRAWLSMEDDEAEAIT